MAIAIAYGNWVLTWSIWSQADAIEETMVVSEIGEQWSPKTLPLKTAAIESARGELAYKAVGTAIGIIIANVPQLVPVENEIKAEVINKMGAISDGFKKSLDREATYSPVPRVLQVSPIEKAKTIRMDGNAILMSCK